jgi:small subunit ribosomal protein S17
MKDNSKQTIKRKMIGTVVSNKMTKTVVVLVSIVKQHPKYHKRYQIVKKYPAHAEQAYLVGDKVEIGECSPKSRTKHWEVLRKI